MTDPNDTSDDRIKALIDDNLKRVYSDIVQEDLPDRFKDLLAILKAKEANVDDTGRGE